jgi:hypothetical protein
LITDDPVKIANVIYDNRLEVLSIRELVPDVEGMEEVPDDMNRIIDVAEGRGN